MQTNTIKRSDLSTTELGYLRKVVKTRNGVNNWQVGWHQGASVRQSLQKLGLVRVDAYKACGMGDCDSTVCTLTEKGRRVLHS